MLPDQLDQDLGQRGQFLWVALGNLGQEHDDLLQGFAVVAGIQLEDGQRGLEEAVLAQEVVLVRLGIALDQVLQLRKVGGHPGGGSGAPALGALRHRQNVFLHCARVFWDGQVGSLDS